MEIKIKPKHIAGIVFGIIIIMLDFYFFFSFEEGIISRWFRPLIVFGIVSMGILFFLDFLNENNRQKELELKFLEFVRALVETVRGGVPIPRAIMQISNENYGSLTPYVKKLASQIEWGYPLHDALVIFSKNTNNVVIKKSIAIVIQAEKSGGDMGTVLQEITKSVVEIKKIKEERRTNAYTQIVQGYLIFFIFIVIMLVLYKFLLPKLDTISSDILSGIGSTAMPGVSGLSGSSVKVDFAPIFTGLVIVQGLFAGLMIGKFSEGSLKTGVKHSVIMVVLGYVVITTIIGIQKPEVVAPILLLIPKLKFKNLRIS
ncbi:MAG: type II secretion system F family protein [Nanoarchaeota archaeon]|nr:type II secretion system F family protein [Nanoarchaeota archaeon]